MRASASSCCASDRFDNALAESVLITLEAERIDTRPWPTRAAARRALGA
ncbi:MAG: hypothetical protein M3Q65_20210 [Chloroflexota bacterium]|nr:hypothetical protein [Chloroflexota bacterium]